MRVLLVNPPSVAADRSEVAPPLGLYILADIAKRAGHDVLVWDGNVASRHRHTRRFYDEIEELLTIGRPDVLATTSMVVNTHVALEVLRRAKKLNPQLITVAGGSHFSAFADEAVRLYPWIDYVVKGEGEVSFRDLLSVIAAGQRLPAQILVAPVTSRELDSARPCFEDVPWSRYFKLNSRRTADYETSRGCVYRCSFCYSPQQWSSTPRFVSDDVVLKDLRELVRQGVRHVFIVDDNFLNDTERAHRLCQRLIEEALPLQWFCYATLNRLSPQMVKQLAAAGCTGLFVGIDAVSAETRLLFRKGFLKNVNDARTRLEHCVQSGIRPTCALIVRSDASEQELDEVLAFAASLRRLGCSVRLNPLIGYQGTSFAPREESAWYTDARIRLMLDGSPLLSDNVFARQKPHCFPYHCSTRPAVLEEVHLRNVHAAATVVRHFSETLLAIAGAGLSIWQMIVDIARVVADVAPHDLRKSERAVAARLFRSKLDGESASLPTRELLISRLPPRSHWIRTVVRVGSTKRLAAIRPFLLDDSGSAPEVLVAAYGSVARVFALDSNVDREELLLLSTALCRRSRSRPIPTIGKHTAAALSAGGLLRFQPDGYRSRSRRRGSV